jgi:competence CoiA-like predicted nuclease
VKKKTEGLNIKYRKVKWLLGRTSQLSTQNKIMVYNQILKLVWTYGIQLWGSASKSNIQTMQQFQNTVLRGIVNAPWYARNSNIHRDLGVRMVNARN